MIKKFLLSLLILVAVAFAPETHAHTVRLFIIGNSFSQNASRYLPQLAKDGGHELIVGRAEFPASALQAHWEAVEAAEANPSDPKGKPYGGKSLRELLGTGTWDFVTIQQASWHSGDLNSYRPYARKLQAFIRQLQPRAELLLHQTWAYRSDASQFGALGPNRTASSQREMWEQSRAAYRTIAAELGVRIIPVGDAFWHADSDPQRGYKKDPNYDFTNPIRPKLPNQARSLHTGYYWTGDGQLKQDPRHAGSAGCYLAGLVWYGLLFGESPEKLKFTPADVPADFAAHLRQIAVQTLSSR